MKTYLIFCVILNLLLLLLRAPAAVLYVDVNSTNPTPPYAGLTTAAVTIQDAVDAAKNGDRVLVNDGIYQVGCRALGYPWDIITNRLVVDKLVIVQSLNGPAVTFINGS